MRLPLIPILAVAVLAAAGLPHRGAAAQDEDPRFRSVRASEANVRIGPGRRYPIAWVFVYRGLPVQVIDAFETWRRIRDWEGAEGWIHQSLLSKRRSVILIGARLRPMRHWSPGSSAG